MRRALAISVCIHFFLFLTWIAAFRWNSPLASKKVPVQPLWVELQMPPEEKSSRNRVVQTAVREPVQVPEVNAFLGKQNQRVSEETSSSSTAIGKVENRANKAKAVAKVSTSSLSRLGIALASPSSGRAPDEPVWDTGDVSPSEYIKGLNETGHTALNTRSYIFYTYFQRIRESLDRAWAPIIRKKIIAYYRAGKLLRRESEHLTRTVVVLNKRGEVVRVQLVQKSGTQDLDEAAIEAFNEAGPFPNPPIGMIDANHEVQVPWDFILRS